MSVRLTMALVLALGTAGAASAQVAVSAHDGKQLRENDHVQGMTPDEIAIIDLKRYPPKVLTTIEAPASMIGAPGAVAVARDDSFALVTAGQKLDPADPTKIIPADIVSVLDLRKPAAARVIQTVQAGPGAGGVAINRARTLALVTSGGDNSVSVFTIRNRKLTPAGKIQLPEGSGPTDVVFTPDGRKAVVIRRGDHRATILNVNGSRVTNSGIDITPGRGPYGVAISPDGRYIYTNNLGGAATRAEIDATPPPTPGEARQGPRRPGTVSAIDLTTNEVVTSVEVGATPETVALSPNGKLLAVVVANDASVQRGDPKFDSVFGLLHIFRVEGGKLTKLNTINNGHWCQGATFTNDGKALLVQCGSERNIEVYRVNGENVVRDEPATIATRSRGGSLASATTR